MSKREATTGSTTRVNDGLRVAILGNFRFAHTSENEYSDAFARCGHNPIHFQEGDPSQATALCETIKAHPDDLDLVVWIRTPQLARDMGEAVQWRLITECNRAGVPLIAVHLDRWWGLEREYMIRQDPYFRVDMMFTADGGHQEDWEAAGIRHRWLPPGISERWCKPGHVRKELQCDVLFVGSWKRYHDMWPHRFDMVQELSRAYGTRFHVAPKHGEPRVVQMALNDYYWSAKVVIGDSCLVPLADGTPIANYCSDRIPETLGRGGILMHPYVEGVSEMFPDHFCWDLGDWDGMRKQIDMLLAAKDDDWNAGSLEAHRLTQIEHIKAAHTYTHRVEELIVMLKEEKLLT